MHVICLNESLKLGWNGAFLKEYRGKFFGFVVVVKAYNYIYWFLILVQETKYKLILGHVEIIY